MEIEIVVRTAQNKDIQAIHQLGLQCFETSVFPYSLWSIKEIGRYITNDVSHCFVALRHGEVIGFILAAKQYESLEDTGFIPWIATHPDYRAYSIAKKIIKTYKKNLGAMLVEHCLRSFHEADINNVITDIVAGDVMAERIAQASGLKPHAVVQYMLWENPHKPNHQGNHI